MSISALTALHLLEVILYLFSEKTHKKYIANRRIADLRNEIRTGTFHKRRKMLTARTRLRGVGGV